MAVTSPTETDGHGKYLPYKYFSFNKRGSVIVFNLVRTCTVLLLSGITRTVTGSNFVTLS